MKRIINCETGEVIERELLPEELEQEKIDNINYNKLKKEQDKIIADRQAIADRLGLSADELKLLLG